MHLDSYVLRGKPHKNQVLFLYFYYLSSIKPGAVKCFSLVRSQF